MKWKKIPEKYFILAGILVGVLALDQWSKRLIYTRFHWGESVNVITNFFAITYVRNTGAAFGLLRSAPSAIREPFFIIVGLTALVVIAFLFVRISKKHLWTAVSLSLILSGAIGNLVDRLRFGYVVDFLDFYLVSLGHFPAFNVADSCIVVGISLMMFLTMTEGSKSLR